MIFTSGGRRQRRGKCGVLRVMPGVSLVKGEPRKLDGLCDTDTTLLAISIRKNKR